MKTFNTSLIALSMCMLAACNNGTGNKDSVDSAKAINDSTVKAMTDSAGTNRDSAVVNTPATPVDKESADFAVDAANGSMAEVAMGQVAITNASSQRVKDFGAMMVKDHTAANEKLKKIALQENITLPATLSDKEQMHVNDLQKKSGMEFDNAYMKMMMDDHKDDIKEFEKASDNCKDANLKNFAVYALPVLHKHLDSVRAIYGNYKY
jgi:putative membrane protein